MWLDEALDFWLPVFQRAASILAQGAGVVAGAFMALDPAVGIVIVVVLAVQVGLPILTILRNSEAISQRRQVTFVNQVADKQATAEATKALKAQKLVIDIITRAALACVLLAIFMK